MKLLESQQRSNIIRRERKVFPSPFSPYFAKKCCFNEVSLVSDVPIRSLILCNCGICEHVQTAIAASSIAVTAGILLPRSEQPVQMRQLCAGGSTSAYLFDTLVTGMACTILAPHHRVTLIEGSQKREICFFKNFAGTAIIRANSISVI